MFHNHYTVPQKQSACGLNIAVTVALGSIGITWQFCFRYREVPWLSIQELPTAIQMAWLQGTRIHCWICSWIGITAAICPLRQMLLVSHPNPLFLGWSSQPTAFTAGVGCWKQLTAASVSGYLPLARGHSFVHRSRRLEPPPTGEGGLRPVTASQSGTQVQPRDSGRTRWGTSHVPEFPAR